MAYCSECGCELRAGDAFCMMCGAPVQSAPQTDEAQRPAKGGMPTNFWSGTSDTAMDAAVNTGADVKMKSSAAVSLPSYAESIVSERAETVVENEVVSPSVVATYDEEDHKPTVVFSQPHYWLYRPSTGEKTEVELPCVLGRGSKCDYRVLGNPGVSRTHARLSVDDKDGVLIEDLASTNSTYVDERLLENGLSVPVADGQTISLADEKLVLSVE